MRKLLLIGIKDLKLIFRDRAALVFMLLAPFLLTIGMGFVTGRFSGSSGGLSDIPVVIVNLDQEQLGNALAPIVDDARQELRSLGIDPCRRAETLTTDEFVAIARTLPVPS